MHPEPLSSAGPGPLADAVIDTNAVLDWLLFQDPSAAPLARAVEAGALRWVATQAMLDELADVLARPAFERWAHRRGPTWAAAQALCVLQTDPVVGTAQGLWCSDPDDQKFIDLALAGPARWLFSRDKALLRLARRARPRGVEILAPARWRLE